MKISPNLAVLLGSCVVFLITPYLPTILLEFTVGNKVGCAAILALVLAVVYVDSILGLAVFMAAAALFIEQRRRIVAKVTPTIVNKPSSVEQLNVPAPNIVPGEVHPPHKLADLEDYSFEPSEESGANKFEAVDESFDTKQPLPTVPPQPDEVSQLLQQKGLAHLN